MYGEITDRLTKATWKVLKGWVPGKGCEITLKQSDKSSDERRLTELPLHVFIS
jgi:hypothetical protein